MAHAWREEQQSARTPVGMQCHSAQRHALEKAKRLLGLTLEWKLGLPLIPGSINDQFPEGLEQQCHKLLFMLQL